jgi:hypothetical protein
MAFEKEAELHTGRTETGGNKMYGTDDDAWLKLTHHWIVAAFCIGSAFICFSL